MSRTTTPCPGCQEVKPHRSAKAVCGECQTLIQEARARREHAKRSKDREGVKLPFATHCLATLYHFGGFNDPSPADEVQRFIFDIVKLVGEETSWQTARCGSATYDDSSLVIIQKSQCSSGGETYWLVPRGLKSMLNTLYSAIQRGAAHAYEEGKETGRNLIVGLATGECSIDEFNEATVGPKLIRAGKRRRK